MYYCANVQHAARLVELFSVESILPEFNGSACGGRICKLNEYFTGIHSDTWVSWPPRQMWLNASKRETPQQTHSARSDGNQCWGYLQ
jgi:hypothetical protein